MFIFIHKIYNQQIYETWIPHLLSMVWEESNCYSIETQNLQDIHDMIYLPKPHYIHWKEEIIYLIHTFYIPSQVPSFYLHAQLPSYSISAQLLSFLVAINGGKGKIRSSLYPLYSSKSPLIPFIMTFQRSIFFSCLDSITSLTQIQLLHRVQLRKTQP